MWASVPGGQSDAKPDPHATGQILTTTPWTVVARVHHLILSAAVCTAVLRQRPLLMSRRQFMNLGSPWRCEIQNLMCGAASLRPCMEGFRNSIIPSVRRTSEAVGKVKFDVVHRYLPRTDWGVNSEEIHLDTSLDVPA